MVGERIQRSEIGSRIYSDLLGFTRIWSDGRDQNSAVRGGTVRECYNLLESDRRAAREQTEDEDENEDEEEWGKGGIPCWTREPVNPLDFVVQN
jgi:hypothetical protein